MTSTHSRSTSSSPGGTQLLTQVILGQVRSEHIIEWLTNDRAALPTQAHSTSRQDFVLSIMSYIQSQLRHALHCSDLQAPTVSTTAPAAEDADRRSGASVSKGTDLSLGHSNSFPSLGESLGQPAAKKTPRRIAPTLVSDQSVTIVPPTSPFAQRSDGFETSAVSSGGTGVVTTLTATASTQHSSTSSMLFPGSSPTMPSTKTAAASVQDGDTHGKSEPALSTSSASADARRALHQDIDKVKNAFSRQSLQRGEGSKPNVWSIGNAAVRTSGRKPLSEATSASSSIDPGVTAPTTLPAEEAVPNKALSPADDVEVVSDIGALADLHSAILMHVLSSGVTTSVRMVLMILELGTHEPELYCHCVNTQIYKSTHVFASLPRLISSTGVAAKYAIAVLDHITPLLRCCGESVRRAVISHPLLQGTTIANSLHKKHDVGDHDKSSPLSQINLPDTHQIYDEFRSTDTQSRHHFKTREESQIYQNRQDSRNALFNLLNNSSAGGNVALAGSIGDPEGVKSLISNVFPQNMGWFAGLFCLQLLEKSLGETDKQVTRLTNDTAKLAKLHSRLTQRKRPASTSTGAGSGSGGTGGGGGGGNGGSGRQRRHATHNRGNSGGSKGGSSQNTGGSGFRKNAPAPPAPSLMPSLFIPAHLEFFHHFVQSADSYRFNTHLISHISWLIDRFSDVNGSEMRTPSEFATRVVHLKALALFLGFLLFHPNWDLHQSTSAPFTKAIKDTRKMKDNLGQVFDVKRYLASSLQHGSSALVVPWVCEFLRTAGEDKIARDSSYFRDTLEYLKDVYSAFPSLKACNSELFNLNSVYVLCEMDQLFEACHVPVVSLVERPSAMPLATQIRNYIAQPAGATIDSRALIDRDFIISHIPPLQQMSHILSTSEADNSNRPGTVRKITPVPVQPPMNSLTQQGGDHAVNAALNDNLQRYFFQRHPRLSQISEVIAESVREEVCQDAVEAVMTDAVQYILDILEFSNWPLITNKHTVMAGAESEFVSKAIEYSEARIPALVRAGIRQVASRQAPSVTDLAISITCSHARALTRQWLLGTGVPLFRRKTDEAFRERNVLKITTQQPASRSYQSKGRTVLLTAIEQALAQCPTDLSLSHEPLLALAVTFGCVYVAVTDLAPALCSLSTVQKTVALMVQLVKTRDFAASDRPAGHTRQEIRSMEALAYSGVLEHILPAYPLLIKALHKLGMLDQVDWKDIDTRVDNLLGTATTQDPATKGSGQTDSPLVQVMLQLAAETIASPPGSPAPQRLSSPARPRSQQPASSSTPTHVTGDGIHRALALLHALWARVVSFSPVLSRTLGDHLLSARTTRLLLISTATTEPSTARACTMVSTFRCHLQTLLSLVHHNILRHACVEQGWRALLHVMLQRQKRHPEMSSAVLAGSRLEAQAALEQSDSASWQPALFPNVMARLSLSSQVVE